MSGGINRARARYSISPERTEELVDWFAAHGPATYHALAAGLGMSKASARYACRCLVVAGLLRPAGTIKTRTRPRTAWDLT